ncbi:MAG: hypothetical protein ORN49_05985, partial [Rhodobacteraceae bacterium]|nr:hypothetical protein [Paracoccaceae bacterium]
AVRTSETSGAPAPLRNLKPTPEAVSATELWRNLVARSPEIETVPDVLAMIEDFLAELDARGALRIHPAA